MHFTGKIYLKPVTGLRLKTFSVLLGLGLLTVQKPFAQVSENFSDGDFISAPVWNGTGETFTVNSDLQLQLNSLTAGSSWLSTDFAATDPADIEWEFMLKQTFAPSGGNFGRVYLTSDQADLSAPLNGYYLQFGEPGSDDAVELFRQSGITKVSICRAGPGGIAAPFGIRMKVTRSHQGLWQLYADYSGGLDYVLVAQGEDITFMDASFFGFFCTYTISNATAFYFDDIHIRAVTAPDSSPPDVVSLQVTSSTSLRIIFSEPVAPGSAQDRLNYSVLPTAAHPVSIAPGGDEKTIDLAFDAPFPNGLESTLTVNAVADLAGNRLSGVEISFLFFEAQPVHFRDIIINEIFSDPSPQVGLPASEFAELYNRSGNPVQLAGWLFTDGTSIGTLPSYILQPAEYLILCSSAAASEYDSVGATLSVANFPTLNNGEDRLELIRAGGGIIDSVHYASTWYGDEDKASGGWALERIDPENVCYQQENWQASIAPAGGTPGQQNSIFAVVPDHIGPTLLEVIPVSDTVVRLVYDEKLSAELPAIEDFLIEPPLKIARVYFLDERRRIINLEFEHAFDSLQTYRITSNSVYDCPGNLIQSESKTALLNPDTVAPFVVSAMPSSANALEILFSEKMERLSAEQVVNYDLSESHYPASAVLSEDGKSVTLFFQGQFPNGHNQSLVIKEVADLAGNPIGPDEIHVLYFEPSPVSYRDVIISELLADPSPPAGLPEAEFAELFNRSENPVDLSGWTISDGTGSGLLEAYILLPRSYLVLSASGSATKFFSFGDIMSVSSFPSLNNSGDMLTIRDAQGRTVDSLFYETSLYRDDDKAEGGWSLERIDPDNICEEQNNWTASQDPTGGTPGRENSVDAEKPDHTGPKLLSTIAQQPNVLMVRFNEKLAATVPSPDQFLLRPPLSINSVAFTDPSLSSLTLSLSGGVQAGQSYSLKASDIYDCAGNLIQNEFSEFTFVLPEEADAGDIVINEILFNPRTTGVDFVEAYNRSQKIIDIGGWSLRNSDSASGNTGFNVSNDNLLIYPGHYKVFTEDAVVLKGEYVMAREETFWTMDLPAFNDNAGSVTLVDGDGVVMDSMQYAEEMHAPFIKDEEGVSLERVSFGPGNESGNWRSASSSAGFATPGYANSNLRTDFAMDDGSIVIEPEIIQPAVSSRDFARIRYRFDRGGFMANVKVFDADGRLIRVIAANELLGAEGFFRWDGDRDSGTAVRSGYYLVWFEVFDAKGLVKAYKKRVAVY